MSAPVIVIIAAGPGVSGSVARLFATNGYRVGLIGRDDEVLQELSASISADESRVGRVVADVTDVEGLRSAVEHLGRSFGRIDVLHFNPSAFRAKHPLELTVDELLADVAVGVGALLTAVQAARPFMADGARITVTGSLAADQPSADAASLGVQKAGVRNLVQSIDAHLGPQGVRAVSVTVRGALSRDGAFAPDRVAEAILAASQQDVESWQTEVPYTG